MSWKLVHHQDNDVIELILNGEEGTERIWLTYEEIADLRELLKTNHELNCKKI
jgi:hypothetical protein